MNIFWICIVLYGLKVELSFADARRLTCDSGDCNTCTGTNNGRSKMSDDILLDTMRIAYANCTRVYGNLEITHLSNKIFNGQSPEEALSFLDDIREVTGYVLIFNNHIEQITLKNLEVIWGDTKFDHGTVLEINTNPTLKILNMPKLKSVQSGSIAVFNNDYLCNWNKTVSLFELLGPKSDDRSILFSNFGKCTEKNFICHPICGKNCWGPHKDMCQIVYRAICPPTCPSGMCFVEKNRTHCCDDGCVAGCYGEGSDECIACSRFVQDLKCVDRCNGLTDYNRILKLSIKHPDPRYAYDRYCVKECPGDHCVVRCSANYSHDHNQNTRLCEKCKGECPKNNCTLGEALDSTNIKRLENCTQIDGFIQIYQYAFEDHMKFDDNYKGTHVVALGVSMLEALRNVKVVTEFIDIQAGEFSPKSLSFLRNLVAVEGRKLNGELSVSIHHNFNLRELGLKSLKSIKNGRVYIGRNNKLCFADSVRQELLNMLDSRDKFGGIASVRIRDNGDPEVCEKHGQVCDNECKNASGCWGRGPGMCFACKRYIANGNCVGECPEIGYFANDKMECLPCHEQCLRCKNSSDLKCDECKNTQIQTAEGVQCIESCPTTHYSVTKGGKSKCLKCHEACYNFGCTGDSEYVEKGGCNKCLQAQNEKDGRVRCLVVPYKL